MHLELFLKGLLAGVCVAVPVGPIGIICIQRTLAKGREHGLVSGLGAATADAIWAFIAASGMIFIHSFLNHNQKGLRILGALFLCFLGVRTFLAHPHPSGRPLNGIGLLRAFTSVFFLALTSPATFVPMVMLFVSLRVTQLEGNMLHAAMLMSGVFLGSISWWLVLAVMMGWIHAKSDVNVLRWVNHIGGVILFAFGLWIFCRVLLPGDSPAITTGIPKSPPARENLKKTGPGAPATTATQGHFTPLPVLPPAPSTPQPSHQ